MIQFQSKSTILITVLLLVLLSNQSLAKSLSLTVITNQKNSIALDSVVLKTPLFKITQNKASLLYTLWDENSVRKFDSIKAYHAYANGVQIITIKNELLNIPILPKENYYNQKSFVPVEGASILEAQNFVCGTVPHYTLTIKETKNGFDLYTDETFYDSGNVIPPEKYARFSKKDVDEVFFINQKKSYSFSSNFQHEYSSTVILRKGDRFWIDGTSETYSSVVWTGDDFLVADKGLYSFYSLNKVPAYLKLTNFVGHYARFVSKSGQTGYLTRNGKEVWDSVD